MVLGHCMCTGCLRNDSTFSLCSSVLIFALYLLHFEPFQTQKHSLGNFLVRTSSYLCPSVDLQISPEAHGLIRRVCNWPVALIRLHLNDQFQPLIPHKSSLYKLPLMHRQSRPEDNGRKDVAKKRKEILFYKLGALILFTFHKKFDLLVKNWNFFCNRTSFWKKKLEERWEVENINSLHP